MTFSKQLYIKLGLQNGFPLEDLQKAANRIEKIHSNHAVPLLSLNHLSRHTNIEYFYLRSLVSHKAQPPQYNIYQVSKRNGTMRTIHSPSPDLLIVQNWILHNIIQNIDTTSVSFAYEKGKSSFDCASIHTGAKTLIKIDLKDFFHTINQIAVYKVFRSLSYSALMSFELARLCTAPTLKPKEVSIRYQNPKTPYTPIPYEFVLPQGAPTSGKLANIIAKPLDMQLIAFSEQNNLSVSRYADDIFISSHTDLGKKQTAKILNQIFRIIANSGFKINKSKLRVYDKKSAKKILGYNMTNEGPKVSKVYIDRTRQMISATAKYGINNYYVNAGFRSKEGFINHVFGRLSYIKTSHPVTYSKLREKWIIALAAN